MFDAVPNSFASIAATLDIYNASDMRERFLAPCADTGPETACGLRTWSRGCMMSEIMDVPLPRAASRPRISWRKQAPVASTRRPLNDTQTARNQARASRQQALFVAPGLERDNAGASRQRGSQDLALCRPAAALLPPAESSPSKFTHELQQRAFFIFHISILFSAAAVSLSPMSLQRPSSCAERPPFE